MRPDLRVWVLSSALLLLGALTAAGAVRLHWLPCRGSMLSGSVLNDYAYGPDFTDACLRAMDSGFGLVGSGVGAPLSTGSVLGAVAVLLLALAWTSVVHGSDWSRGIQRLALLPSLASVATLVLNVDGVAERSGILTIVSLVAPNLLALGVLLAVWVEERPGAVVMLQVALALAASTAAGLLPMLADYAFMVWFSDANWDAPPGSGYPTAVGIAVVALVLPALTLVRAARGPVREGPAQSSQRSLSLAEAPKPPR